MRELKAGLLGGLIGALVVGFVPEWRKEVIKELSFSKTAYAAPVHQYIKEYAVAQSIPAGGCVATVSCSVASLASSGTVSGTTFTGTSFTASAGSGSNGLAVSTSGARVDFGAGASDYASSDGTTVTFAGPLASSSSSSASYTASAGSGSNAFAASTNGARFDIGAGASDYFSSNGTTITTPAIFESTGATMSGNLIIGTRAANNNAFQVTNQGARYDMGGGTNDYLDGDGTAVRTAGYGVGPGTAGQFAGAPTAGDCDADAERGRLALDTSNNRLYVCNGSSRGWDYVDLTN